MPIPPAPDGRGATNPGPRVGLDPRNGSGDLSAVSGWLVHRADIAIRAFRTSCDHSTLPRECTTCWARAATEAITRELSQRPEPWNHHELADIANHLEGK